MPMLICHEKSLEELHSITWRNVFRKHSVFTGLLCWIWKPGDILFSPQVTEHFSDITSLQKRYALQFPMSRAELLPLFYSDFPLYSDGLIFCFYMKAAFCGKTLAHIGVQGSFFFRFFSQWLYHQLHCEQDWPGAVSLFQQGQGWLFLVPIARGRDVSKTKPVSKLLPNRVWHTNLATAVPHYFGQGAGIEAFKWIAPGNLEQPCRRKRFFGKFKKLWAKVAFSC